MRQILLIAFVLFCNTVRADNLKDINVRRLSVEEGLSQFTVITIYQDEFGFIWTGTMDGLNRYDGKRFEVFKPDMNDSLSIRENNIRYICGDGDGHLFIKGLESVSVYDMRANTFRLVEEKGVRAIFWHSGKLYLAIGSEIYTYHVATDNKVKYFSFAENELPVSISCFGISKNGDLLVSTVSNGFFRVNSKGQIIQHSPVGETNSITEDSDGNIWISTRSEGLYKIDSHGLVKHYTHDPKNPNSLSNNNVRQICQDAQGNFYIGTFNGLSTLDPRTDTFTHYRHEFKKAAFNIRSILTMTLDRHGTLWIGTFYDGMQCYSAEYDHYRYYIPSLDIPGRLSSPIISSITEDDSGLLWIGTEGGGVNILDRNTGLIRTISDNSKPHRISSNVIKSLFYQSEENAMWIATLYNGINRMDLQTSRIEHIKPEIRFKGNYIGYPQHIVKMLPAGTDTLIMATNTGLVIYDKKQRTMSKSDIGFISNHRAQIWDICKDADGHLWMTSSTDLYCVNLHNNTTKRYPFKEISGSHVNNYLNKILFDSRGRLWFGSSGSGLFLYNKSTDSFKNYNISDGLDNGFITALVENPQQDGKLYVATNSGLSLFDPETVHFQNYGVNTGFPLAAISDGGLYITSDGEIFASGLNGLVSIKTSNLSLTPQNYEVYVSGIYVNNSLVRPNDPETGILQQSVLYQKKIKLRPHQSVITLHFTCNDFLNLSHSQMEYKLEGFDNRFFPAPETNNATYTNLNPGTYNFVVRGSMLNSNGERPRTSIEIVVLPPFYKSWWFITGCIVITCMIIGYFIRAYAMRVKLRSSLESEKREKHHIREINQAKLRFFTNVSHEFRTPLTLIDAQLELLLQKSNIRPTVYSRILSIYKNSQRMRRLVDEIIDIRKQEQGFMKLKVSRSNIITLLREVFLSFDELAKHRKINYLFDAPESELQLWFDSVQMEKVTYNLISNAFKYTPAGGTITLAVADLGDDVEITLTDNGVGIAPEHIHNVFERFYQDDSTNEGIQVKGSGVGLSLTKAIVEMHEGTISVESQPNVCTRFTVTLGKQCNFIDPNVVIVDNQQAHERFVTDYDSSAPVPETEVNQVSDKSVKILIVEDNEEVRNTLVNIFEPIYSVTTAENGEQGIKLAREDQPDIILSDIMMPVMSGIDMCRKLKSDVETCHIPIVLLTARTAEEHKVEGLLTGADDYVTKPFSVKLLIARCNNLVAGRRRIQQKYMQEQDAPVDMLCTNPADQQLLSKAIEVINTHIDNVDFDVKMFSREMALSRTYLFSKIKGLTGQTPNEFVVSIRLKKAASILMSSPKASMSDIAYDLGFSSSSYFIKCFKDMYGKTPNAYRNEQMKK